MKKLIEYFVDNYDDILRTMDYVSTAEALKTKYEQNNEGGVSVEESQDPLLQAKCALLFSPHRCTSLHVVGDTVGCWAVRRLVRVVGVWTSTHVQHLIGCWMANEFFGLAVVHQEDARHGL